MFMVFYHMMRHDLDVARSEQASRDGIPRTFLPCFIAFCSTIYHSYFFSLLVYTLLYNPTLYTNLSKRISLWNLVVPYESYIIANDPSIRSSRGFPHNIATQPKNK